MAPVNGIPFLDYLINSLLLVGIENILILVGYKSEIIINRYKKLIGLNIEFSIGKEEYRTGRRLLNAYDKLDNYFLLLYGDNYWPVEIEEIQKNYSKTGASITTTVFSNKKGTGEYGFLNNIKVGENGNVLGYDKKGQTNDANGVDIGYFLIDRQVLDPQMSGNISFEIDVIPNFIKKKEFWAYITDSQYYYITDLESLRNFESITSVNHYLHLSKDYFRS